VVRRQHSRQGGRHDPTPVRTGSNSWLGDTGGLWRRQQWWNDWWDHVGYRRRCDGRLHGILHEGPLVQRCADFELLKLMRELFELLRGGYRLRFYQVLQLPRGPALWRLQRRRGHLGHRPHQLLQPRGLPPLGLSHTPRPLPRLNSCRGRSGVLPESEPGGGPPQ
jgi:hypothetical protein